MPLNRTLFAALALLAAAPIAAAPVPAKEPMSAQRAKAIRECNDLANKFRQRTWGKTEFSLYRTCMSARNETE